MKEIAKGVYVETTYPGVTLGAVIQPHGILMIDAPPRPDDGRSWLSALRSSTTAKDRLLVTLDAHPDRTLGARTLDSTVIAHKDTARQFINRPTIFKAQALDSGAEWEELGGLSGIRWLRPHLTFNPQTQLHLGGNPIYVEHHPGPEKGSAWVILPEEEIVFVGDTVMVKQPPFLQYADLDAWVDSLDLLLSKEYRKYTIVSGRGGVVDEKQVRNMRKLIVEINKRTSKLGRKSNIGPDVEKLIPRLLSASDAPAKYKVFYTQRLKYGLYQQFSGKNNSKPAE